MFAEELVIEVNELHLTYGREQLPLLNSVELEVNFQLATSAGHSSRCDKNHLVTVLLQPSYLVDNGRETGYIELPFRSGEHI